MSASDDRTVEHPTEQINQSRRRWVVGALAGPAAVSLPLSASAAAFGSITNCIDESVSTLSMRLHVGQHEADKWARMEVVGIVLEQGSKFRTVVDYEGRCYDDDFQQWYPEGNLNGDPRFLAPDGEKYRDTGQRAPRLTLVFAGVDDKGQFTVLDPQAVNLGYVPISTSCYISLAQLQL